MLKYVFLAILCGLIFLVCWLIDTLVKRLAPKSELEKSKQVVRLPRRSAIFGVLLLFFPLVVVLFFLQKDSSLLIPIGCAVSAVFGVVLLVSYFSFAIWYDDETFLYKSFRHKKTLYHYSQIKGQRSLLTRGGVNSILFVGDDEINVYSAMDGLSAFLSKAFYKWCQQKGIDPASVENNPSMLTWFPDPDKEKVKSEE
jgi:hypothetical protein